MKFSPIKPSNIVVLFPPGSGGNFLIKMLSEKCIFKIASGHAPVRVNYGLGLKQQNEYSYDYFPIIAPRHLNQFFTQDGGIRAGPEIYSLARYRQILNAYRYSKFIIVHTSITERGYCESLNIIKSIANSPDKFSRPGKDMNKKLETLVSDIVSGYSNPTKFNRRRPHHYREFSKRLRKQGNHVMDVEYSDLFSDPKVDVYHKLAEFVIGGVGFQLEETADDLVRAAKSYHQANTKVIKNYLAAENLKSISTYASVKDPGAV
jgi:hypothetical protein